MSDVKELFINPIDKEVKEALLMRLFQWGLCSLIDGEYICKSKLVGDFVSLNLLGLSKGNLHNDYRTVIAECFGDKIGTKEPELYRVFKKYGVEQTPKVLYNVLQSYLYKVYGEF